MKSLTLLLFSALFILNSANAQNSDSLLVKKYNLTKYEFLNPQTVYTDTALNNYIKREAAKPANLHRILNSSGNHLIIGTGLQFLGTVSIIGGGVLLYANTSTGNTGFSPPYSPSQIGTLALMTFGSAMCLAGIVNYIEAGVKLKKSNRLFQP